MKLYRYEIEYIWDTVTINMREFHVQRETRCGYWILHGYSSRKWISKTGKKRFAYPTQEEAKINFIKRTERRISILKNQVESCEAALKIMT